MYFSIVSFLRRVPGLQKDAKVLITAHVIALYTKKTKGCIYT